MLFHATLRILYQSSIFSVGVPAGSCLSNSTANPAPPAFHTVISHGHVPSSDSGTAMHTSKRSELFKHIMNYFDSLSSRSGSGLLENQ
jgi:hypothetical protein